MDKPTKLMSIPPEKKVVMAAVPAIPTIQAPITPYGNQSVKTQIKIT